MDITVQLKLKPGAVQATALEPTLHALNVHASEVSCVAFEKDVRRNYDLRKLTHQRMRDAGVGPQAAQHVIKKVADAFTTLKADLRQTRLQAAPQGQVQADRLPPGRGPAV